MEVSRDEIAMLRGYDGLYDSDYKESTFKTGIGTEIELNKVVKTAKYVRTLDSAVLEQSHERLLAMAERLSDVRDLVYKLNLFEDLKKQADVEELA